MGFWGFESLIGDKRRLDKLLEEKEEYEIAIRDKHRDWTECKEYLPFIVQEIERLRIKLERGKRNER